MNGERRPYPHASVEQTGDVFASSTPEVKKSSEMWKCEGEKPLGALEGMKDGKEKRKDPCQDQKIKDTERGIYGIMDGVSSGNGEKASRIIAREMYRAVASPEVAARLESLRRAEGAGDAHIDRYVRELLAGAVARADRYLSAENAALSEDERDEQVAQTTLSFGMAVKMRDGHERFYYVNSGDSRIALVRDGKLSTLTVEDNLSTEALTRLVASGQLSEEDASIIEQSPSYDAVPQELKEPAKLLFGDNMRSRNTVTAILGLNLYANNRIEVQSRELMPGDTLVITSDGIHDNLLDAEIEQIVTRAPDEQAAERSAMQEAERSATQLHEQVQAVVDAAVNGLGDEWNSMDEEAQRTFMKRVKRKAHNNLRTKGYDDLSIVVHRVGAIEAPRPTLVPAENVAPKPNSMSASIREARAIAKARAKARGEQEAAPAIEFSPEQKRQFLEDRLEHLESQRREIADRIPHRFEPGMTVRLPISGDVATISEYDAETDSYVFLTETEPNPHVSQEFAKMFNVSTRSIDRFVLEDAQGRIPLYPHRDRVTVGGLKDARIAAYSDVNAFLERPDGKLMQVPVDAVREAVHAAIASGKEHTERIERTRQELERAGKSRV